MNLTDIQLKILKYVAKRKTPVTSKDVQLQTKINRSTAIHALHFLAKKGYIKSKPCIVNCRKEYFFEFITMEPVLIQKPSTIHLILGHHDSKIRGLAS